MSARKQTTIVCAFDWEQQHDSTRQPENEAVKIAINLP